jgi:hypothetical protein
LTLARTPVLAALVEQLDAAVQGARDGRDVPHAVGEALHPFLGLPRLLTPSSRPATPPAAAA